MLHTKFRGNRSAGSGEEDIWNGVSSWSPGTDALTNLFPLPIEAPHKIWIDSPSGLG